MSLVGQTTHETRRTDMNEIVFQAIETERQTGRQYRIVKRYEETGKYMEARTLRRYSLLKRYI